MQLVWNTISDVENLKNLHIHKKGRKIEGDYVMGSNYSIVRNKRFVICLYAKISGIEFTTPVKSTVETKLTQNKKIICKALFLVLRHIINMLKIGRATGTLREQHYNLLFQVQFKNWVKTRQESGMDRGKKSSLPTKVLLTFGYCQYLKVIRQIKPNITRGVHKSNNVK